MTWRRVASNLSLVGLGMGGLVHLLDAPYYVVDSAILSTLGAVLALLLLSAEEGRTK